LVLGGGAVGVEMMGELAQKFSVRDKKTGKLEKLTK
jgi:NADH dehydrogenase FAD-containing subunit